MDDSCARGTVSWKGFQDFLCMIIYLYLNTVMQKVEVEGLSADQNDNGINSLPDEILISILSRLNLKEAVRSCLLSKRWRCLWRFAFGSLDFDGTRNRTTTKMERNDFIAWVNRVLELHQGSKLDSFIVRCNCKGVQAIKLLRWIYFAMQKEVKTFELRLGDVCNPGFGNAFPRMRQLLSLNSVFVSLRSLKLQFVDIKDEVVHYFLASCSYLESLSIIGSKSTKNLRIVDPIPNLKLLEILFCHRIQSVEISATNLVSFSYGGQASFRMEDKYLFKNIPNLSELTLIGESGLSFIYEPNKHSYYSVQLVKLSLKLFTTDIFREVTRDLPQLYALKRLELDIVCKAGGWSLLFFTSLIKASPLLSEFRIKLSYDYNPDQSHSFPSRTEAESSIFNHENLKLVEVVGYIGSPSGEVPSAIIQGCSLD